MAIAKIEKSEEYRAYCKLQYMRSTMAKMLFFLRACEADDALVSEAVHIIKMMGELEDAIDDIFLDGYFKELNEKFEKGEL